MLDAISLKCARTNMTKSQFVACKLRSECNEAGQGDKFSQFQLNTRPAAVDIQLTPLQLLAYWLLA